MEDQRLLEDIFRRYLKNQCSPHEVKFLLSHFNADTNQHALRDMIAAQLNEYPLADEAPSPRLKKTLDDTLDNILNKIDEVDDTEQHPQKAKPGFRPFVLSLMAGIAIAAVLYQTLYTPAQDSTGSAITVLKRKLRKTKISPGGNKATLTLQDGSTIVLDYAQNGTVAKQGSATVVKLANGQLVYNGANSVPGKVMYNTMSTPRGGQYKLTLPDGTVVWLNSASSITYPTAFVGQTRKVSITGEAYFEVAKDKAHPFNVKAGSQNIEVLGTHFNVMAYADEDAIKTTLVEGSVKVSQNGESDVLRPGEQSVNKDGAIKVGPAAIDEVLAWKNGYFKFNRIGIKPIMRQLARWYDVDVVYDGRIKDDEFVGTIARGENIEQALHLLELTNVHFKIKDKTIIVLPY